MALQIRDLVQPAVRVNPMIYAYTTPGVSYHDGYIKIGYTEQDVQKRIDQQTRTAGIVTKLEWSDDAVYEGTRETFRDTDFHLYLRRQGVRQPGDEEEKAAFFGPNERNEWFAIGAQASHERFLEFRANHGVTLLDSHEVMPYRLREEQELAVRQTMAYFAAHEGGEFLWNAKPRFGKTLSTYDLARRMGARKVLILTNRPAIANSWYEDYERFIGRANGYFFVSAVDSLKEKKPLSYKEYQDSEKKRLEKYPDATPMGVIDFVSLQDLKTSIYFGGAYDKLREISAEKWDLLVVDEAHEGVDTNKTEIAFDQIHRRFTLHLSGTPFKALANDKFPLSAIYNWTYADEQAKKRDWQGDGDNPYAALPRLNLFTYRMSEIVLDEIQKGIDIDGKNEDFAFDLNEFFAAENGKFKHDREVDRFLDALTTQEKFPFSTPALRDELRHTFWMLDRVESARLLAKKLQKHPVFSEYKVVLAAGDGKVEDDDETKKAFDRVRESIKKHDRTITLSVGQLSTGVTIPEWTAVLMLSNVRSPALYMQAAFRAQNPCLFETENGTYRKENAYVFDFDPARTLIIFEQFANDLTRDTAAGRGDITARKAHILELLNFFPVIGEDENGEMTELDAEKVLSIPRRIKCVEVVRRGFMSDFLFANISNIFRAPQEVVDLLNQLPKVAEPAKEKTIDTSKMADVPLDDNGDVQVSQETVIGISQHLFGEKIYGEKEEIIDTTKTLEELTATAGEKKQDKADALTKKLSEDIIETVLPTVKDYYGENMHPADEKQIKQTLTSKTQHAVGKLLDDYKIQQKTIDIDHQNALQEAEKNGATREEIEQVHREHDEKQEEARRQLETTLTETVQDIAKRAQETAVEIVETNVKTRQKESIEDEVRDHLRGFARTIPSFLMAYGTDDLTLANFDAVIPDDVFVEVTSITLSQFRLLRDGADYVDRETGKTRHYPGHLFDETVFNDAVQEFLHKREALSDYFDETHAEDIFDYIPPQKNNQIFTPRRIVRQMVDALEAENPGCFDDPTHTFADLYMKSGLYITEIVKRLYNSPAIKQAYPDDDTRIRHILQKQVYGLAPTRIIYEIATNYILGFDETLKEETRNFKLADAAEAARNGTLEKLVEECFGK